MATLIRHLYDGRDKAVRLDCSTDKDMCKQEFKDECDINMIMARYQRFGVLPPPGSEGRYGDFSQVGDLLDAQIRVQRASQMFDSLPSKVRDRFANNPLNLLSFVSDSKNRAEAISLGLIPAPVEPEGVSQPAKPAGEVVPPKG